jgi:prepilin-type N-terminal cleavage/methylation domain-containing protein
MFHHTRLFRSSDATAPRRAARDGGFTLIEILITCTVIGILAGITVPTYVSRRISANEGAIVATLRAVAQAQFQFRAQGSVDVNQDGGAEYGTLGELSAADPLRGQSAPLTQRLLSASLGRLDGSGFTAIHGYLVAIYLPDASGVGLAGTLANRALFDPINARDYYTCLAWPTAVNVTGHRAFFVNQQGQILKTLVDHYSGNDVVPPPGAALQGTSGPQYVNSQTLAVGGPGADGLTWTAVN